MTPPIDPNAMVEVPVRRRCPMTGFVFSDWSAQMASEPLKRQCRCGTWVLLESQQGGWLTPAHDMPEHDHSPG